MLERSNMCMGIMDSQISIYVTGIVVYCVCFATGTT